MTPELIFNVGNLFVVPFWAIMILLPNWVITRKVMNSFIPFAVLAVLYIYLFGSSLTAENAAALSNPKLADIAKFLGEETAAATGWIHFLVMDLFVGRWIYWEGQRTGVWTVHSLALCFFAGPMGLLSHIVTAWITQRFFPSSEAAETVTSSV
ncbi:ABA4-like family protein [Microcoleus sp. AT3-A2]|uniref:ABA4-like family protein n=1 Tax=Microcoleus sp. AT3-A2 TaxID=2818610 RepID=UPI002FCE99D7